MLPRSGLALALGVIATLPFVTAGPCDLAPCVAAHGTTRALSKSYSGPLYQVKRASDGKTTDIKPLSAGGVANAASQDSFCAGTTCLITVIYDQSGHNNHLTQAPPGGAASGPEAGGFDNLAAADGAPVLLNGKKAYGVYISPGTGYRNDVTNGVPTGDAAQSIYAVLDGTVYNDGCCFDYGNAETNNLDTGDGHMEAIYFGANTIWGSGNGAGPWLMADLENGLFSGYNAKNNPADPSISYQFLTAIVKGEPNQWALRGGNAASGSLSTYYSGVRPAGYNPMHKEGALLLGIGGDNSISGTGLWYEGCVYAKYNSDATEASIQSDIVAAKYANSALTTGPAVTVGSSISFKATTPGYTDRYLAHSGATVNTQVVSSSSSTTLKQQASWTVRSGLGNSRCVSFEAKDTPGSFLRHYNFVLQVGANDNSKSFKEDATFCPQSGLSGQGNSIRAWNYPTRYIRHFNNVGYVATNSGTHDFDAADSFVNDATWALGKSLA